jgi:hypothetical protein
LKVPVPSKPHFVAARGAAANPRERAGLAVKK